MPSTPSQQHTRCSQAGGFSARWSQVHTQNNVQPGPIDTDLNPASGDWAAPQIAVTALKRYGHVDEIAAMVAFIAGPEAAYITGASLTVDGGTNA
jgi:3-oxoacyl-[acyl-carrier protein] reductase